MDTAAHWVYEDPEIKALQEWRLFSPPLETMEHVSVQFMSDRLYKLGTERQQYGHYCTNGHLCELVRHCELNLSELITADMVAHLAGEQTGPHQICGIIHVYLATAVCFDWGAHWGAQKHTVRSRENMTKVDNLWFHFILDFVYLFFYWFSVSSVLISEQCGCISHRSVLGSVIQPSLFHRETTHTHTHTHTHASVIVKWGQRSECVFRQLIIFPAPETDGWRKVLAFSSRRMTQMKLLTPHHTLIRPKSISCDK